MQKRASAKSVKQRLKMISEIMEVKEDRLRCLNDK